VNLFPNDEGPMALVALYWRWACEPSFTVLSSLEIPFIWKSHDSKEINSFRSCFHHVGISGHVVLEFQHRQKGHVTVLQYRALRTIHFPTISGPPCNGPAMALSSLGLPWMLAQIFAALSMIDEDLCAMYFPHNPRPANTMSPPFFD
jgi:hypothetical protein